MQVTQQVYIAEEWVKNARDEVKAKAHSYFDVEKALRALKEEYKELGKKLTVAKRERSSALASLKNAKTHAEEQRKLLYIMEIELATYK